MMIESKNGQQNPEKKWKDKALASARALLGKDFEHIAIMCSLEPGETWKDWYDPYGNKLRIYKNTARITQQNKTNPNNIKDIYAKSNFGLISGSSYWCFLISTRNKTFCWFIGFDGKARFLIKYNNKCIVKPPLSYGYKILKNIAEKYLDEDFVIVNDIESMGIPCDDDTLGYMTPWPPKEEHLKILRENKIV